jgi:hypothetical protein
VAHLRAKNVFFLKEEEMDSVAGVVLFGVVVLMVLFIGFSAILGTCTGEICKTIKGLPGWKDPDITEKTQKGKEKSK